jgi:hypothetical protein
MSERNCIVKVTGKEGEYLQITDMNCKYKAQIHESLIMDNNYEVIDSEFEVSEDSFNHWFKKDIEAEKKRIRDERFNLFYPNISLFWDNREMILKEPRYYSIIAPEHFYGMMYVLSGNPKVTLGELLQMWENEEDLSVECNACGGKSVVYRFGGSPLSGTIFEKKTICLQCGKIDNPPKYGSLGGMMKSRLKYSPIEPIAETPASLQELVAACEGDVDEIDNCKATHEVGNDFGQPFVQIGNKKLSTEQFTKLLTPKDNKQTE